jgi:hypothetical protein
MEGGAAAVPAALLPGGAAVFAAPLPLVPHAWRRTTVTPLTMAFTNTATKKVS